MFTDRPPDGPQNPTDDWTPTERISWFPVPAEADLDPRVADLVARQRPHELRKALGRHGKAHVAPVGEACRRERGVLHLRRARVADRPSADAEPVTRELLAHAAAGAQQVVGDLPPAASRSAL